MLNTYDIGIVLARETYEDFQPKKELPHFLKDEEDES
jgi:hypothetical protein